MIDRLSTELVLLLILLLNPNPFPSHPHAILLLPPPPRPSLHSPPLHLLPPQSSYCLALFCLILLIRLLPHSLLLHCDKRIADLI